MMDYRYNARNIRVIDGVVTEIMGGKITLEPEVTR